MENCKCFGTLQLWMYGRISINLNCQWPNFKNVAFPHPENVKNIWNVFGKLQVFSEHHRFVCMNGFSKTFLNKSHIFYHKKKQCLNIVGESLRRGEKFIDLLVRPNFTEYFFLSHHFTWVICFFVFFFLGRGGGFVWKKKN